MVEDLLFYSLKGHIYTLSLGIGHIIACDHSIRTIHSIKHTENKLYKNSFVLLFLRTSLGILSILKFRD